jgi:hypothetical protein
VRNENRSENPGGIGVGDRIAVVHLGVGLLPVLRGAGRDGGDHGQDGGTELPPGQILAKKGQRGIQEDVLGEGRHFLNPWLYDWDVRPVLHVPPGKVAS